MHIFFPSDERTETTLSGNESISDLEITLTDFKKPFKNHLIKRTLTHEEIASIQKKKV